MVIIASKPGQLSNRLFMFAHFIAHAIENGGSVWNPAFDDYAHRFPSTAGDILSRFPKKTFPITSPRARRALYWIINRAAALLTRLGLASNRLLQVVRIDWQEVMDLSGPRFSEASRAKLTVIQGWLFLDDENLKKHASVVRTFFEPNFSTGAAVQYVIERAKEGTDLLVGVHIRRGDYATFLGGKYLFSFEDYKRTVNGLRDLFPDQKVSFLVASNEGLPPEITNLEGVTTAPGEAVTDLYCLAACDYIVGPPSTYSMWASFFGQTPLLVMTEPDASLRFRDFAIVRSQSEFPEVRTILEESL